MIPGPRITDRLHARASWASACQIGQQLRVHADRPPTRSGNRWLGWTRRPRRGHDTGLSAQAVRPVGHHDLWDAKPLHRRGVPERGAAGQRRLLRQGQLGQQAIDVEHFVLFFLLMGSTVRAARRADARPVPGAGALCRRSCSGVIVDVRDTRAGVSHAPGRSLQEQRFATRPTPLVMISPEASGQADTERRNRHRRASAFAEKAMSIRARARSVASVRDRVLVPHQPLLRSMLGTYRHTGTSRMTQNTRNRLTRRARGARLDSAGRRGPRRRNAQGTKSAEAKCRPFRVCNAARKV